MSYIPPSILSHNFGKHKIIRNFRFAQSNSSGIAIEIVFSGCFIPMLLPINF